MSVIIHIIPTLGSGGAEAMLYKILKNKINPDLEYKIITLKSQGFYKPLIEQLGVEIIQFSPKNMVKIIQAFREADLCHSWMYHADLFNYIVGKLLFRKKIIWGIRRSNVNLSGMKKNTYRIAMLNSRLSRNVDKIISCTEVGLKKHHEIGYSVNNSLVIPNGFDLKDFKYKSELPNREVYKFINIARWEQLKDHETLLQTFSYLKSNGYKFTLKLIGKNIDKNNEELVGKINKYNLFEEVELIGETRSVPKYLFESDFYVSSSISEGFPNVLGEAMATGLICIATDAGDSRFILGSEKLISPIKSSKVLYEKIKFVLNLKDKEMLDLKNYLYQRLMENFEISNVTGEYEKLYMEMLKRI